MKQYTLQQAIDLCEEHGGKFWRECGSFNGVKSRPEYTKEDIPEIKFDHTDLKAVWFYEPPKSAFQKWNEETPVSHRNAASLLDRKQGWIGFAENLEQTLEKIPSIPDVVFETIEKLKEP